MELAYIIGLIFFIAFFIESIFGFGGLVLSFAMLGFFIDIKQAVYLWLYVAVIGSIFIIVSDYKKFSTKRFIEMFSVALIWVLVGTFFFDYLSSDILLKIFATFLFIFSLKNLFFNSDIKNKILKRIVLFFGGILQGVFWTGWPFTVMAMKDSFKNKSELRTTMALFFIVFNIIRAIQLYLQGSFQYQIIIDYSWLAIILLLAVTLGHKVHIKISDKVFNLGINYILLASSILLFLK